MSDSTIDVSGVAPGADSDTDVMFTTVDGQIGRNYFPNNGIRRANVVIVHNEACTLTWYRSVDGGTNWIQLGTQALTGSATESNEVDIKVEGERDWKLEVTNGGSAQTTWSALLTLVTTRQNAA